MMPAVIMMLVMMVIDDDNNARADDGHDYLDCSKPVELKTCIVVALSS